MKNMMVVFLICAAKFAMSQNDLSRFGIKGKVKKCITTSRSIAYTNENNWYFTDSSYLEYQLLFNTSGNVDTMLVCYYTPQKDTVFETTVYRFDKKRAAGWTTFMRNSEIKSVATIEWLCDTVYKEYVYDKEGNLKLSGVHYLDHNMNIYKSESFFYSQNQLTNTEITTTVRDGFGPARQTIKYSVRENETQITNYIVLEKDDHANPLKTLSLKPSSKKMIERKYVYR